MATRVRKLARELKRSPRDVLGLLHAVGYTRYKSPEDMLPDLAVRRVRQAQREGMRPVPVQVAESAPKNRGGADPDPEPTPPAHDLMRELVPGVVPQGSKKRPASSPRGRPSAPQGRPAPAPPAGQPATRGAGPISETPRAPQEPASRREAAALRRVHSLEAARDDALNQVDVLSADVEALQARVAEMEAARAALEAKLREAEVGAEAAQALREEVESLRSEGASAPTISLLEVLEARGLKGRDEYERALTVLASARILDPAHIAVLAEAELPERLKQRLILVDGPVPAEVPASWAAVSVSPDRAEVPGPGERARFFSQVSEQLLLLGARRVALVGGMPLWHRLVKDGLDARVDVRCMPSVRRTAELAENDVTRTELVVLWGVTVDEAARDVYDTSRALLVEISESGFREFLHALQEALEKL